MQTKKKSLIGRIYDSFATGPIGVRNLTNQIRGLKPQARFTQIKDYVSKGGDLKKLVNINGESIMFNPNITSSELSLFKKQGLLNIVNKQGSTLISLETKKLFENLNKNNIDSKNISKINFLLKNGVKLDEKIGKSILKLQELYPNIKIIQDLSTNIKQHHSQIADKYFKENKSSDSLLKAECRLLFTNLNKDQIDLKNLKNIENLLKNGAVLDINFKDSILKVKEYYPNNTLLLSFVNKIESGDLKKERTLEVNVKEKTEVNLSKNLQAQKIEKIDISKEIHTDIHSSSINLRNFISENNSNSTTQTLQN